MLFIYNTMTKKIEKFEPLKKDTVKMYVCGPTVYSDIHIGNARPVIFFDMVKRYLSFLNYDVIYVSNITDIDDKIIQKAFELELTEDEVASIYTKKFIEVTTLLGSNLPDQMPRATQYINQMIEYINELIAKGFAYQTKSGVYFKVDKIEEYGKLSGQNKEALELNVRIENKEDKKDAKDFVVWKNTTEGKNFKSPWGNGRPGWHTECSVMNHDIFKGEIDIHGGGSDLIFPHHENEIAQSIAHENHSLAKYWMHVGRLDIDNVKMSKSIGNVVLVKDLITKYSPMAFRLLILGHHYRQPIKYQEILMGEYQKLFEKIRRVMMKTALEIDHSDNSFVDKNIFSSFLNHMNQDFNTPNVITIIHDLLKLLSKSQDLVDKQKYYYTMERILHILGIELEYELTVDIQYLYQSWISARDQKDYQKADELRNDLIKQGWL